MKKITNSKDLNQIYSTVNSHIDKYIEDFGVTSIEIYNYIKKNMSRFLEKFNLKDTEFIEQIVKDVIEHRKNMEKDKIIKFEKFNQKIFESLISISSSDIEHEKVLADFYNSSIGHIQVIEPKYHLYEVKDFDTTIRSIIYSKDEIKILKDKIIQKIIFEIVEMSFIVDKIEEQSLEKPLEFNMKSIVSESTLKDNINTKLDNEYLLSLITNLIPNSLLEIGYSSTVDFKGQYKEYYIWEI